VRDLGTLASIGGLGLLYVGSGAEVADRIQRLVGRGDRLPSPWDRAPAAGARA
jgi:hypothetical protein